VRHSVIRSLSNPAASSFRESPVKILAIRFARLGDVILLMPALAALKDRFPDSELTLLTGHRCAPIAELCPAIDQVIAVDRIAMRDGPAWRALRDMIGLVRNVRQRRFDIAIDFHSFRETNLLTWLSGAPVRVGMKRYQAPFLGFCFNTPPILEDKALHVAEMFRKVAEAAAGGTMGPCKRSIIGNLAAHARSKADIVLFVDAPVPERIWPPERFAEVADFASEKLGAKVAVVSSTERPNLADRVQKASRNPHQLLVFTDLTLPRLAALIASAQLLISNDTGPMHIGPAVGVPTLALFSVGYPEHFRPIGEHDRFLRAMPIEDIETQKVIETLEQMWTTAGRDLRR